MTCDFNNSPASLALRRIALRENCFLVVAKAGQRLFSWFVVVVVVVVVARDGNDYIEPGFLKAPRLMFLVFI